MKPLYQRVGGRTEVRIKESELTQVLEKREKSSGGSRGGALSTASSKSTGKESVTKALIIKYEKAIADATEARERAARLEGENRVLRELIDFKRR